MYSFLNKPGKNTRHESINLPIESFPKKQTFKTKRKKIQRIFQVFSFLYFLLPCWYSIHKSTTQTPEPKTKTTMTRTFKVSLLTVVILTAIVISSATSHADHGNDLPTVVEFHLMAESEFLAEKNLMNEKEMSEKERAKELHLSTTARRSSCSGGHLLVPSSQATLFDYIQQCFDTIKKNSWTLIEFFIEKIDDFATAVFASACMLVLLLGAARVAWSSSRHNDNAATTATVTNAAVLLERASNQVEHNNENQYEEEGEGKIQSDTSISPSTSVMVEEQQGSSMLVESYSSAEPSFEDFSSSDMHAPTAKTTMSSSVPLNDHPSQEHSDNDRAEEEEEDDDDDDDNIDADENDGRGTPSLLTQAITKASQVYHKLSQSQHENDDDQEIDKDDDDDPDNMSMSLLRDRSIEEFQRRFQNIEELTNKNSGDDGMKRSMTVPLRMPSSMLAPAPRRRRRRREKTPIRSRNTRPCLTTTGENSSTELNFQLSRDGSSENPIALVDDDDDTSEEEVERETFPLC